MKNNILFITFILIGMYQPSYAKQPIKHTHNGRTHTHFLPQSGLNHSHTAKQQEIPKKINKSKKRSKKPDYDKDEKQAISKKINKSNGKKIIPSSPDYKEKDTPQLKKQEFCNVKIRLSSDKNFTGMAMTGARGEGEPIPVKIENLYILVMPSRKTYITLTFNSSTQKIANVTDHRTEEQYKMITFNMNHERGGLFANHDYLLMLGGQWRTEPRSIRFSCPNAKGQYNFTLPQLKHIGIFNEG